MSNIAAARQADSRWWIGLCVYLLVGLYAVDRTSGPRPRWVEPDHRVSAARARETLAVLLGEEELPHRAGQAANENVRVRLLGLLDELGVQTWVLPMSMPTAVAQRTTESKEEIDKRFKITSPMANIVARVAGEKRGRPVVLASHYDSAFNAPGAGDAGQCVAAILETVRALKAEPLRYEVWLLLTDAEEFGLWGAQALVEQGNYPWGAEPPVVINFDARGDRGAVLLYETHENNLRAMQVAAEGIAAPQLSTSLMVNVYKRLPNGTDFTVFRQAGWCGWNFAVVAGADRYHTEEDNLANLSPRSVQHFAAHAHGLLHRLDEMPEAELKSLDQSQPASFFDVLGWFLVVYPASWNYWHLGLIAILLLAAWLASPGPTRGWRVAAVAGAVALMAIVAYGVGWAICWGLTSADALPRNFVRHYEFIMLLYVVAAAGISFAFSRTVRAICVRHEVIAGVVLAMALVGALCCRWFSGGAYLFLWPATWLVCLWLMSQRWPNAKWRQRAWSAPLAWCLVPAILYSPTYILLAQAMGPRAGTLITTAVSFMLLPTWIGTAAVVDLVKDPLRKGCLTTSTTLD